MPNAMNLTLPVPSVTLGPAWAEQLNEEILSKIAEHRHSPGQGNPIGTAGLLIDGDLSLGEYSLSGAYSVRFSDAGDVLSGPSDLGCLYDNQGDLWWNNASGTPVQITVGASPAIGAVTVNAFQVKALSTNYTIPPEDAYTYFYVDTAAARTIYLPQLAQVPAGRFYYIKDCTGGATTYKITITAAGSDRIDGQVSQIVQHGYAAVLVMSTGTAWNLLPLGLLDNVNGTFGETARNTAINGADVQITAGGTANIQGSTNLGLLSNYITVSAIGELWLSSAGIKVSGPITGMTVTNDPLRFGVASVTVNATSYTLTNAQYGSQTINLSGNLTGATVVTFPAVAGYSKLVYNGCNSTANEYTLQVKASGGANLITIPRNQSVWVYCTGTELVKASLSPSRYMPVESTDVLVWPFSESTGGPLGPFASTGSNAATLAAAGTPVIVAGIHDNALQFTGVGRNVVYGGASVVPAYPLRVSLWCKPANLIGSQYLAAKEYVLGDSWTSPYTAWSLKANADGYVTAQIVAGGVGVGTSKSATSGMANRLNVGQWNHVGFFYTGLGLTLYVNGISAALNSTFSNDPIDYSGSPGHYVVGGIKSAGNTSNFGEVFCGIIDDVRIAAGDAAILNSDYFRNTYRRGFGFLDDATA